MGAGYHEINVQMLIKKKLFIFSGMSDLEELRKKKLQQLQKQYVNGGNIMEKNWPDTPIVLLDADLDENVKKLLQSGFLTKEGDAYTVNLVEQGFDKLLGAGGVSHKFIVTVGVCSEKARQKIEGAGGQVILTEGAVEPEETASEEKAGGGN